MDTLTLPISSPKSVKRSCSDAGLSNPSVDNVSNSIAMASQEVYAPALDHRSVSSSSSVTSPAPAPSSLICSTSNIPEPPATVTPSATHATKKRTKLTASGKDVKRLEKEAKEKEKAQQKARKEEEKVRKEKEKEEDRLRREEEKGKKEAERRAKDAEKEKKRLEKEEQNRLKDEEKRKKEEEKNKKQRSQLRLNAFFIPPNLTKDGSTPSPTHGSLSPANSRRSSITSISNHDGLARERSVSATPSKTKASDYDRLFPSFFLHSHTTMAPRNRFERDEEGLQYTRKLLDDKLASGSMASSIPPPFNPHEMLHLSPYKRRKLNSSQPSVKAIVEQLHGTSQNPIDLTGPQRSKASQQPLELLKTVSTRYLKFAEDVRPPYIGTYSRVRDPAAARKICRNPFTPGLPNTDYDYDSEAEWEDPGEGEDLDSEGEEEIESEDGDDMEGFLDDDEDATDVRKTGQKRRLLAGDLEPMSTGLCWEDAHHNPVMPDLASYRLEVILENPKTPIDPYSTAYWEDTLSSSISASSSARPSQSQMDPPRIPLNASNRTNFLVPNPTGPSDGLKMQQQPTSLPSQVPQPPKRMVSPDVLDAFKRAVEGSDLTKAGLVEVLKKQFPKQSKDAIKDTLGVVAERVGTREKDKRWVVRR